MDITKSTVVELKALAFDELTKMEACQRNLNIINAELVKRNQPTSEETTAVAPATETLE